jgi:hypothetical protein
VKTVTVQLSDQEIKTPPATGNASEAALRRSGGSRADHSTALHGSRIEVHSLP